MNTELVKIDPKEFGLEEVQVATIEQAFMPKIAERDGYAQIYEQIITKELTPELCAEARELRLKLVKTRTGIAEIHKTQKAFFLAAGKFVDAWKNKETAPVEQMEEKLSEIEKYFENIEKERIAKLEAERTEEISLYSEVVPGGLGTMDETVYQNYLTGVKVAYDARIKAKQEAEAERLRLIEVEKENARLKAIEDERIRKENERLKAEAEAKEKEIEAERKRQADLLAKQKAEADEKARIEKEKQDAILAKERAEAKAKQKAIEEAARIEREKSEAERKRLENELRAKQEAERKAKEEKEMKEAMRIAAEKEAAKAPDIEKLKKMVDSITITIPELTDATSIAVSNVINAKFEAFKNWAKNQIETI
jgi:hypothetical protein